MTSGKRHGTAKARTDWPKFRDARGAAKKTVSAPRGCRQWFGSGVHKGRIQHMLRERIKRRPEDHMSIAQVRGLFDFIHGSMLQDQKEDAVYVVWHGIGANSTSLRRSGSAAGCMVSSARRGLCPLTGDEPAPYVRFWYAGATGSRACACACAATAGIPSRTSRTGHRLAGPAAATLRRGAGASSRGSATSATPMARSHACGP